MTKSPSLTHNFGAYAGPYHQESRDIHGAPVTVFNNRTIPLPENRVELLNAIDTRMTEVDDMLQHGEKAQQSLDSEIRTSSSEFDRAREKFSATQAALDNDFFYKNAGMLGPAIGVPVGLVKGALFPLWVPAGMILMALKGTTESNSPGGGTASGIASALMVSLGVAAYSTIAAWGPLAVAAGAVIGSIKGGIDGPEEIIRRAKESTAPDHDKNVNGLAAARSYVDYVSQMNAIMQLTQPALDEAAERKQILLSLREKVNARFDMPTLSAKEKEILTGTPVISEDAITSNFVSDAAQAGRARQMEGMTRRAMTFEM